ncbi:MAG: hypothetical protein QW290_08040 [Sulfolobales archaeon]
MSSRSKRKNKCYWIKGKSFDEIKRKAEFLNKSWSKLKKELIPPEVTITFLYQNEYAPLIGTICDEQVKADDAWKFPEWLNGKIGGLTPEKIEKLDKSKQRKLRELLEEYFKNKWPNWMKEEDKRDYLERIPKHILDTMRLLKKEGVTPATMFENREYTAAEVYLMLRRLPGIGPKKAKMIAKHLQLASEDILGHPWFTQIKAKNPEFKVTGIITPPIDVQVVKVFCRIFGVKRRNWKVVKNDPDLIQDIEAFSMLAFPDMPATIDEIFWNIGREYCKEEDPRCSECPLNNICDYAKKKQASST